MISLEVETCYGAALPRNSGGGQLWVPSVRTADQRREHARARARQERRLSIQGDGACRPAEAWVRSSSGTSLTSEAALPLDLPLPSLP